MCHIPLVYVFFLVIEKEFHEELVEYSVSTTFGHESQHTLWKVGFSVCSHHWCLLKSLKVSPKL